MARDSGDGQAGPAAREAAPVPALTAPDPAPASGPASGPSASGPATATAKPARGPVARTPPAPSEVELPDGQRLVRDERGVRVVHDEEAD